MISKSRMSGSRWVTTPPWLSWSLRPFLCSSSVCILCILLWCERPTHWQKTLMRGKIESKRRRGRWKMRWLEHTTDSMDISLSKLQEIVKAREAWHAAVHGVTKCRTQLGDWTTGGSHYAKPGRFYTRMESMPCACILNIQILVYLNFNIQIFMYFKHVL